MRYNRKKAYCLKINDLKFYFNYSEIGYKKALAFAGALSYEIKVVYVAEYRMLMGW